jgi:hypothetical protein
MARLIEDHTAAKPGHLLRHDGAEFLALIEQSASTPGPVVAPLLHRLDSAIAAALKARQKQLQY